MMPDRKAYTFFRCLLSGSAIVFWGKAYEKN